MPGGFSLMVIMPVAGILVKRVQPKYLMAVGLLITAASMWHLAGFNTTVPFWHLAWARVFQAIGLPLFFVPLNTIAYSGLPPGKSNNASALLNLMRNLGGGIGISIAVTILARRQQFHQNRLGSHFTMYDWPFRTQFEAMVSHFVSTGATTADATTRALSAMYQSLQAQSLMLSYVDVFQIMAVGCMGVVVLVLFLQNIDRHSKVEVLAH
jgi:DHA2 family multidrug resistance protein